MTTGSKIKFIPTIFVVVALLAVAWIVLPNAVDTVLDNNDVITLDVMFKPEHRTGKPPGDGRMFPDSVTVELVIGGAATKFPVTEPWHRSTPAVPGERIKLTASQVYGAEISVKISRPTFPPAFKSGVGPTEVSVVFTVR